MIAEKLKKILKNVFKEEEFGDCFLIEIVEGKNNKVQLFIDSDSGMDFQKCRKISRKVEEVLDAKQWLGEKYILEVGSPGLDRPLKLKRQYYKNIGREVIVQFLNGDKQQAKLIAVNEEQITIEYLVVRKQGKKKIKEMVKKDVKDEEIKEIKIKISF